MLTFTCTLFLAFENWYKSAISWSIEYKCIFQQQQQKQNSKHILIYRPTLYVEQFMIISVWIIIHIVEVEIKGD